MSDVSVQPVAVSNVRQWPWFSIGFRFAFGFLFANAVVAAAIGLGLIAYRSVIQAINESHAAEQRLKESVVSKEFSDSARALALAMKAESANLTQAKAVVKSGDDSIQQQMTSLENLAKSGHEHRISSDLSMAYFSLHSCLEIFVLSSYPTEKATYCKDKLKPEEVDRAVDQPF